MKSFNQNGATVIFRRISVLLSLILAGCGSSEGPPSDDPAMPNKVASIDRARILGAVEATGEWLTGGRDFQQSYFSPLSTINTGNIRDLGFAWQYEIDTEHGFEATPIVVDGVMFSSGPKGAVYALDAKTGRELWTFYPAVDPNIMQKLCCGVVNRGVAVWKGSVFVASLDGYLYSLDAETGEVEWKADTFVDRARAYSITGAPQIAGNVVVIGNGGAELDARGYVSAYDTETGEFAWRFYTVPGDPKNGFEHPELEIAAKTWDPDSMWEVGLGGTAYDAMAWDPDLNLLYVGTGNATPWVRKIRSPGGGDNLYLSSILAINPDTGALVWHYQTTPAENWDYTATQKLVMADLIIDGQVRQVIMQAPKNGFFYVLDRASGELISAEPYVPVNWASHVDMATGKPVETGQGEYFEQPKLVFPGSAGGHNWQPMSYSSQTGLVYVPTFVLPMIYSAPTEPFVYQKGGANFAAQIVMPVPGPMGLDGAAAKSLPSIEQLAVGQPDYTPRAHLKAWDPVKQKVVWEVETSGQWRGDFFSSWNGGGVMSTAGGLLFQGRATGNLVAMNALTGEQLHSIDVGTSLMAAPMTFEIDGEQYVSIMAGLGGAFGRVHLPGTAAYKFGNKGRIVTFKLGGGSVPMRAEINLEEPAAGPPVAKFGSLEQIAAGGKLYQRYCGMCHRGSGGTVPDLTKMDAQTHSEFLDIVLRGTRAEKGMGSFGDILSEEEAKAIHAYVVDLAWKDYEAPKEVSDKYGH